MNLRTFTFCTAGIAAITITTMLTAADWPGWRGPARDAISLQKNITKDWEKKPPKHLWTTEGFGSGYASVSIVSGTLYTTGNKDGGQAVIAADAETGKVIWEKVLTDSIPKHGYVGSRCTPTVSDGHLYIVTSAGQIACLNAKTGDEVWAKSFQKEWNGKMMSGWGYSESPLVDGDRVLCTPGGKDAMIVCLDKKTGEEIWKSAVPAIGEIGKDGAGYSSIVISNGAGVKQYVQLTGRGLIGVRAEDGKFLWGYNKVANKTANIPTPLTDGDYIFGSTGYGTGSCLLKLSKDGDGVKAEEEYFLGSKTFQNHHGGMVLKDGYVYAGHQHNEGFPICVEMKTGEVVWGGKLRGPGKGSAAVLYVDGHLIYRYQNGTVALIQATPKGYELKGTFEPDYQEGKTWAHPVVVDGKLYLREQDKLMCYDISS